MVIFVPSNLTLSPQSWQQPKIIFLLDNVTPTPVKNPLHVEKYLSSRDNQAILAPLDSSRIFFLNQRESLYFITCSMLSTALNSSQALLSHFILLQSFIGMANLSMKKSLAGLPNWSRSHDKWQLRFRLISDSKAVILNPGCTFELSGEL